MIKDLKVENLEYNGRAIPNQFIINYKEMVGGQWIKYKIFQSYESEILKWIDGQLTKVGKDWDYSSTTGKYRNILTGMTKKEFKKYLEKDFILMEDGTYNRISQ